MAETKRGLIAVIFVSRRTEVGESDYAAAAAAMAAAAARQPGFVGMESVRDSNGHRITISYWRDEASVLAWRDDPDHSAIRARGRADWYDAYETIVTTVTRDYRWSAAKDPN